MSSKMPAIAISAMLLLSACRGTDSAPSAPDEFVKPLTARAAPSTPLAVTVEDQGPLGAYRIQSDGLGEYVHGVQTITAEIDGYGNLQFGPTLSNSLARTLRFDFSAPADPLNTYRPNESGQQLWKIKTNPNVVAGTPKITDLGLNGNPVSGCYGSTIAHQNAGIHHRAIFNTASDPQSTNVYITRTSISPATWTMVSDGVCGGNPNWAGLWSQDLTNKSAPLVFRGYFNQQFSLRLRAL